jgi:hypothetical protein
MSKKLFIAALLAATPWSGAHAQERNLDSEPSVGKVFAGTLDADSDTATFLMTLRGGQAIDLTVAPVAGSDPAVRVVDAASDLLLASNDDSNGSLASNVRLYSEANRRVRIEVTNAALERPEGPMRFDLILRPSDYRPRAAQDIELGSEYEGTLGSNEEQLYRFTGERGQVWTFRMASAEGSSLDPAVEVFAGDAPSGEALGGDDDGGGGLNSQFVFAVPENGDYVLRAYAVGSSQGAYTLTTGAVRSAAVEVADIALGVPLTGSIDAGQERIFRLDEASRAVLAGEPGALVIELTHTEEGEDVLDPIVAVGFDTPLGFSAAATNDDGGGGTNASVTIDGSMLTPAWLESLRIKASGYLQTDGPFELVVRRAGG